MTDVCVESKRKPPGFPTGPLAGLLLIAVVYVGCYFSMVRYSHSVFLSPTTITHVAEYRIPFRSDQTLSRRFAPWTQLIFRPIHWIDRYARRGTWETDISVR